MSERVLLDDVVPPQLLQSMLEQGYVRAQHHPRLPYTILNYTEKAAYDRVWNDATRACRGLIHNAEGEVIARPWPKFFNYGEFEVGILNLEAPVRAFDKLDGSLGILYPEEGGWAIATRGSFTSGQAVHATSLLRYRYLSPLSMECTKAWEPAPDLTYLFEIIYPGNRIVVDYGKLEDLVLLDVLVTATGEQVSGSDWTYPGLWVEEMKAGTLQEALEKPPRPNSEGLVLRFASGLMLKLKQDDYVVLHRILTGTNARHVWEVAAVEACHQLISEPKHWGTYLGIAPERANEVLALGNRWLDGVPDEFYGWVAGVTSEAERKAAEALLRAEKLHAQASVTSDRRQRYEIVSGDPLAKEIMQLIDRPGGPTRMKLRAWREACPEPTAPFHRPESIA